MTLSPHLRALLQALFVTLLWSTSWVLIKFGLKDDIPALTFAGLRYTLAFLCLLLLLAHRRASLRALPRRDWGRLLVFGLLFISFTQGMQYLALDHLPAITTSLLLSFTAVLVALLGIIFLNEQPSPLQWAGIALYLCGVLVYFYPVNIPTGQVLGLVFALLCVLGNALSAIFGRSVNRTEFIPPLTVTVISMGIGALVMLGIGGATQGLPTLSLKSWAIIGWLAVVNTAFAFTVWNLTQRTLSAVESSLINNTMLI